MHKHLYLIGLLPLISCAAEELERTPSASDAGVIEAAESTEVDAGSEVLVPD
jgi:hypothetical protein